MMIRSAHLGEVEEADERLEALVQHPKQEDAAHGPRPDDLLPPRRLHFREAPEEREAAGEAIRAAEDERAEPRG